MILSVDFLRQAEACEDGIQYCIDNNIIGMEYSDAIKEFIRLDLPDYAGWLIEQKKKEIYVRFNGTTTMTKYNVFNPITGINTKFDILEDAKKEMINVATQILQNNALLVTSILTNENGDEVWQHDNTIKIDLVVTSL